MELRRVYVSSPLQASPDLVATRKSNEWLATLCRGLGWQVYVPHTFTDPQLHAEVDPGEVFARDLQALHTSSLVIADIGSPSSGVGAELAFALVRRLPIIAIWKQDQKPSRFILGLLDSYERARCLPYRDPEDLRSKLTPALKHKELEALGG